MINRLSLIDDLLETFKAAQRDATATNALTPHDMELIVGVCPRCRHEFVASIVVEGVVHVKGSN